MNPDNPNTNPVPAQPPAPVPAPPVPPIAPPQQPAPAGVPLAAAPRSSGGKTGLIVGIIAGILVLAAAIVLAWIFFFSPAAQAKKASTAFMKAAGAGDADKLVKLIHGDDGDKSFMESAAKATKGEFSLKDKTMKDGKGYFLYNLTNEQGKMGRTIVEKQDGAWLVTSYVFGSDKLALVPGDISDEPEEKPAADDKTSASACLVQSDFDAWYKADYGKTATALGFKFNDPVTPFTTNVHFPADSLEYESSIEKGTLENIAELAKDPSVVNKQFTIRLKGNVGTSQSDAGFANQRAEKVKADLIALGIPAAKIAVDAPGSVSDFGNSSPNSVQKEIFRSVVITLDPTCTAAANGR